MTIREKCEAVERLHATKRSEGLTLGAAYEIAEYAPDIARECLRLRERERAWIDVAVLALQSSRRREVIGVLDEARISVGEEMMRIRKEAPDA